MRRIILLPLTLSTTLLVATACATPTSGSIEVASPRYVHAWSPAAAYTHYPAYGPYGYGYSRAYDPFYDGLSAWPVRERVVVVPVPVQPRADRDRTVHRAPRDRVVDRDRSVGRPPRAQDPRAEASRAERSARDAQRAAARARASAPRR